MKIYLGIVGSKKVQSFAEEHNCGWCLTPDNARPVPNGTYFLDNGAFTAWKMRLDAHARIARKLYGC
jgi:hypothetical protein